MAPRKSSSTLYPSRALAVVHGDSPIRVSKLPPYLRFPLLLTLSLTLSSLLYSITPAPIANDLSRVSRSLDQWWEVGVLIGYRALELGLAWAGDYDAYDLAALTVLSHGPALYLLSTFYNVSSSAVALSLTIDTITAYLPFRLLRPLSPAHAPLGLSGKAVSVPNQEIISDIPTTLVTILLPAAIYALAVYTSFASYMPVHLVTYFDYIPSIAATHTSTIVTLFPFAILAGVAAHSFIFVPAAATTSSLSDAKDKVKSFDSATASLVEIFWQNVPGFERKTKVVLTRTLTLLVLSGIGTFTQCFVTVEGVHVLGALGYAAVWVGAAAVAGMGLGFCAAV